MCKTSSELKKQIEELIEDHKERIEYINDLTTLIIEYTNLKIAPYSLSNAGENEIKNFIDKFPAHQILDGIDEAFSKNVIFDKDGIRKESIEAFLNKMPNFIAVMGMPPVRKKILYIRGIARNRFSYWDEEKGTILLEDYVKALEDYGWSVQEILRDLENEIQTRTKRAKNWSEWKNLLQSWTKDISHWEKTKNTNENIPIVVDNYCLHRTEEEIENYAKNNINNTIEKLEVLLYLCKAYPNFNIETCKNELKELVNNFINKQQQDHLIRSKSIISYDCNYIESFLENSSIFNILQDSTFEVVDENKILSTGSLFSISYEYAPYIMSDALNHIYYTEELCGKDCDVSLNFSLKYFKELVW